MRDDDESTMFENHQSVLQKQINKFPVYVVSTSKYKHFSSS
jgi:hypothetical protein